MQAAPAASTAGDERECSKSRDGSRKEKGRSERGERQERLQAQLRALLKDQTSWISPLRAYFLANYYLRDASLSK